ncbi:P-loop containing nucleoside triphosphate hydrolase protein [Basidiobolus meristosporus CBS 931.73]|uniref:p-loop containing nucleoside triphosphate hydrolase protein n=1 Tax=Basidiobolus meristosporus CBS 931.73 TaxID=1314790 RepID=A0A1Y1YB91_9FUNG|nr:P-loop containing nucleoside triphosphate hydrolase protein [Basidiobolus meristosporus CBS 931.73]|eukprot:ORX95280.1 P-loop containing nucleoside triphosphate hydrolase protein [Basidiobolus meristosporus CBS 931.73]
MPKRPSDSSKDDLVNTLSSHDQSDRRTKREDKKSPSTEISDLPPQLIVLSILFEQLCTIVTFFNVKQPETPCTLEIVKSSMDKVVAELSIRYALEETDFNERHLASMKGISPESLTVSYSVSEPISNALPAATAPRGLFKYKTVTTFMLGLKAYSSKKQPKTLKAVKTIREIINQRNAKFKENLLAFFKHISSSVLSFGKAVDSDIIAEVLEALIIEYLPCFPEEVVVEELEEEVEAVFPSIERLVNSVVAKPDFLAEQVLHKEVVPARDPVFENLPVIQTHQQVKEALKEVLGIEHLYSHQSEAIQDVFQGKHVAVSTSTSSGKSLIFHVPILSTLLENPSLRALYIFPNKALAQDQLRNLNMLLSCSEELQHIKASTYDGDTDPAIRAKIRDDCQILFTNPDMLHSSILPFHRQFWDQFLMNLRFVVIDEIHTYFLGDDAEHNDRLAEATWRRSFFGVHLPDDPLGQLRFLCGFDDKYPPTKHHPELFASTDYRPTGLSVVCTDGSPCGKKHYVIWQSNIRDIESAENKKRLNLLKKYEKYNKPLFDVTSLFVTSISHKFRTVLFCKVMNAVVTRLQKSGAHNLKDRISSYRGGYLQQERREIERRLFQGDLLGVITTNALELGLDIGSIDVVIHYGFPDSYQTMITDDGRVTSNMFSSYFQQAGRCGRRQQESLSLLVLDGSRRDEWLVNHVDTVFSILRGEHLEDGEKQGVDGTCDTDNYFRLEKFRGIVERHLQCAAHEQVFVLERDASYFGGRRQQESSNQCWLGSLLDTHLPSYEDASDSENVIKYYRPNAQYLPYPANTFSLRTDIHGDVLNEWSILTTAGVLLENMDHYRALCTVYPKAYFYRRGIVYVILKWDIGGRNIIAQEIPHPDKSGLLNTNFPHTAWSAAQGKVNQCRTFKGTIDLKQCLGSMRVSFSVDGLSQRDSKQPEKLHRFTYSRQEKPPPVDFDTYGCWMNRPRLRRPNPLQGVAFRTMLQGKGIAIDQWSLKTECTDPEEAGGRSLRLNLMLTRFERLVILDATELRQPSLPLSQANRSIIQGRIPSATPIPSYLQLCYQLFRDLMEETLVACSSDVAPKWDTCGAGCYLRHQRNPPTNSERTEADIAIAKAFQKLLLTPSQEEYRP